MNAKKGILIFFIILIGFIGAGIAQDSNTDSNSLPPADSCGDGICAGTEGILSCPADCDLCGDGICSINETIASCGDDCSICGDQFCSGTETALTCEKDCKANQPDSILDPVAIEKGIKTAQRNLIVVVLIGMACLGIIFGMFLMAKYSGKREQARKNAEIEKKIEPVKQDNHLEETEHETDSRIIPEEDDHS